MFTDLWTRRGFLSFPFRGIGATAALSLLMQDGRSAPPHFSAKAKRVVHVCLCGGLSQIDSFDYKPELEKRPRPAFGRK
ncbi:MAG: hypothetical protein U0746_02465 [Gemmataceae bacterium]